MAGPRYVQSGSTGGGGGEEGARGSGISRGGNAGLVWVSCGEGLGTKRMAGAEEGHSGFDAGKLEDTCWQVGFPYLLMVGGIESRTAPECLATETESSQQSQP